MGVGFVEGGLPVGRTMAGVTMAKLMELALSSGDIHLQFGLATSPALHHCVNKCVGGRYVAKALKLHVVGLRDVLHDDICSALAHITMAMGTVWAWSLFGRSAEAARRHLRNWATKILLGEFGYWAMYEDEVYEASRSEGWLL
jgi:hypothetical protein